MTRRTQYTVTEEYETEDSLIERAADVYWEYWSIKTVFGLIGLVLRALSEALLES
jgi:hypothetical protein